jgi:hypothetical protein
MSATDQFRRTETLRSFYRLSMGSNDGSIE